MLRLTDATSEVREVRRDESSVEPLGPNAGRSPRSGKPRHEKALMNFRIFLRATKSMTERSFRLYVPDRDYLHPGCINDSNSTEAIWGVN